ncbi:hypothetical protein XELAEV_18032989mg [Xenopus laevis]|uniref:Uncharacterized protein n=1 Tax=Xenopus laevis TaxID=8355 RepID=A0A974HE03_XENLA|nr:hypothetical protein XELAEV_18032989mg [Xenopus laevis]
MINKDLCDHHTFPEEAVKGDCETCWILEQFDLFIDHGYWSSLIYSSITDSTGEAFLVPENSELLFCFGYYVLYDLAILKTYKVKNEHYYMHQKSKKSCEYIPERGNLEEYHTGGSSAI